MVDSALILAEYCTAVRFRGVIAGYTFEVGSLSSRFNLSSMWRADDG